MGSSTDLDRFCASLDGCKEANSLNLHISALIVYVECTYGESEAAKASVYEMRALMAVDTHDAIMCKRALLLFAIANEPTVFKHFTNGVDLKQRVLPFITPRFINCNCQSVEAFVILTAVLHEMWEGDVLCSP